jgi:hypothetical protein
VSKIPALDVGVEKYFKVSNEKIFLQIKQLYENMDRTHMSNIPTVAYEQFV